MSSFDTLENQLILKSFAAAEAPPAEKGGVYYSDDHLGMVVNNGTKIINLSSNDVFSPPRFSGDIVTNTAMGVAPGTGAVTANQARAGLWIPDADFSINNLTFEVTTLLAGNARVAVYDSDGANGFFPGTKLWVGAQISTATVGVKPNAVSPVLAVKNGHPYWIVLHSQAAYSIRGQPSNGVQSRNLGVNVTGGLLILNGLQAALTFTAGVDSLPASGAALFPRTTRANTTVPHFTMTLA